MQSEELYYDHYKETFERQIDYLKERNRLTVYLVILVAVIYLMGQNRAMLIDVSAALQEHNLGKSVINFNIISTVLYFVFMWFTLRYYLVNLTIETGYAYLGHCEKELSKSKGFTIDREGANYLKDYPYLKWLAHRIYVYLFPILVIAVSISGICYECGNAQPYGALNAIFLAMVVFMTFLYLVDRKTFGDGSRDPLL